MGTVSMMMKTLKWIFQRERTETEAKLVCARTYLFVCVNSNTVSSIQNLVQHLFLQHASLKLEPHLKVFASQQTLFSKCIN